MISETKTEYAPQQTAETSARKSPFGFSFNSIFPLKQTRTIPVIEITKPIINHRERSFSFKKKFLLTDIINNEIIFKQYCNTEEKENPCHINNNEDENKLNNMIYTPRKEYARKFNSNIQSKINKIPKGYSIQRKKKLINKNLIGYLAFNNSNSIKSKNSHIYEDSFSYKKSLENSKINDFNPTRKLVFEGINDSIENSGKKKE